MLRSFKTFLLDLIHMNTFSNTANQREEVFLYVRFALFSFFAKPSTVPTVIGMRNKIRVHTGKDSKSSSAINYKIQCNYFKFINLTCSPFLYNLPELTWTGAGTCTDLQLQFHQDYLPFDVLLDGLVKLLK